MFSLPIITFSFGGTNNTKCYVPYSIRLPKCRFFGPYVITEKYSGGHPGSGKRVFFVAFAWLPKMLSADNRENVVVIITTRTSARTFRSNPQIIILTDPQCFVVPTMIHINLQFIIFSL